MINLDKLFNIANFGKLDYKSFFLYGFLYLIVKKVYENKENRIQMRPGIASWAQFRPTSDQLGATWRQVWPQDLANKA